MSKSQDCLGAALETASQLHRGATRLSRRLHRGRRQGERLSLAQLGVLGELHRAESITASALAEALRVRPQSLTRLLAQLESRRLVVRHPDPADRRQSLIALTETGRRLLAEDVGERRTLLAAAMVETLSGTEQEMLRLAAQLMDRLAGALEARAAR
jgi:DNA-binding MarR family transcriptional regulator